MSAFQPLLEQAGAFLALLFTLFVLAYVLGDNPLTRFVLHIFVGTAGGYVSAVALKSVILPRLLGLFQSLTSGQPQWLDFLLVIALIVLMLMKISPRTANIGNPAGALLVGVGAATAIGGAVLGTIFPLIGSAGNIDSATDFLSVLILLLGMITTLVYFHFSVRAIPNQIPKRNRVIEWIGFVGKFFIVITFGVIYAGVLTASLSALVERVFALRDIVFSFFTFG